MNDREFRRRAHALLSALNGPLRPGSGTELDLNDHEADELRALLKAGAENKTCDCGHEWGNTRSFHAFNCPLLDRAFGTHGAP